MGRSRFYGRLRTSKENDVKMSLKSWQIRITSLFSTTYFFYYLARYNFALALPFMMIEFNVTKTALGIIATALTLAYGFGQLINGFLTDRVGTRIIMTIGGLMAALFNFLMGQNYIYDLFILIWALNGYFQAMGYPATCKLVATWFKREDQRGKPLGMSEMFQSIASIIVIPMSALLAVVFGWRMIFTAPAVMLSVASIIFYALAKNAPNEERTQKQQKPPLLSEMKESYRKTYGNWRLVSADFSYGFSQFVRYSMITWLPIYFFTVTGFDIFKAAWFSTVFQIGGALGSPLIGWLNDKYFYKRKWLLIAIGMLISGLCGGSLGFVPATNPIGIIAILLVCGVAIESLEVSYFLIPVDSLGEKYSATGVGCMNAVGKFVASLQGIILGWMADLFSFSAAFATAGIFGGIAALLVIPSRKIRTEAKT